MPTRITREVVGELDDSLSALTRLVKPRAAPAERERFLRRAHKGKIQNRFRLKRQRPLFSGFMCHIKDVSRLGFADFSCGGKDVEGVRINSGRGVLRDFELSG